MNNNTTQHGAQHGANNYRIAVNGDFAIKLIGPLMTLPQAQAYTADMRAGGFDVMVVNVASR